MSLMYIFSYISQIKYSYIREHLLRMCVLLARTVASYAHTLSHSHTADEKLLKAGNLHAATLCSIFILMPNPVWVKFACVCAKFQANRIFTAALCVFLPKVCTVYSPVTQQQLPATVSPNCLHVISNREKKLTKT